MAFTSGQILQASDLNAMLDDITAARSFRRPEAGAVTRTEAAKLGDIVDVRDFEGCDPTGTTFSDPAFQAAFATGQTVRAVGTFRLQQSLAFAASRQWFIGYGCRLLPSGNFDLFTCGAGRIGCGIAGIDYDGTTAVTGGHMWSLNGAERFTVRDVNAQRPWHVSKVVACNFVSYENVWVNNIKGPYGTWWYGDNATGRSDILRLAGFTSSGGAGNNPIALIMDGAVQTLQVQQMVAVNVQHGILVRNSGGATLAPAFIMADDLEVDFPTQDAVRIETGSQYYFVNCYVHGSAAGSGYYVGNGVVGASTQIMGGKITGHARYGIENGASGGGSFVRVVNPYYEGNALGNVSGDAGASSPRFSADQQGYFTVRNGDLYINADDQDYIRYLRSTDRWAFVAGGAEIFSLSGNAVTPKKPVVFQGYSVAGLPAANANLDGTVRVIDRNNRLATSDGVNWRWAGDGAVVS